MAAPVIHINAASGLPGKDKEAFVALYERYWHPLFETAYAKTGSKTAAEDIVQELFIAVWNNGIPDREQATVSDYLFGALRNRILNYFRDCRLQEKHLQRFQSSLRIFSPFLPHHHIQESQLQQLIEQEVNEMPATMQHIYRLSREQGYDNRHIARELSISPQTVRNQLSHALKRIRTALMKESAIPGLLCLLSFYWRR